MKRVLVAGAARYLGNALLSSLANDPEIEKIIGIDITAPVHDFGRAEFIRADIRNPVTSRIIDDHNIDTVVHAGVLSTPLEHGGRTVMKEINVIGSMQLLAACKKSPSVKNVIIKSTTAIYGASAKDPALFRESTQPGRLPTTGFAKDANEVEGYVRNFARERSDVRVTTLRFANAIGPEMVTPLTTYFELPVWPAVLGHDPRLQFIHEDDLVRAMHHAVITDQGGTFNIAGGGTITLSQAARLAKRPLLRLPAQFFSPASGTLRRLGVVDLSREQLSLLKYGRLVDTYRARDILGFTADFSSRDTFEEFVAHRITKRAGLRGK